MVHSLIRGFRPLPFLLYLTLACCLPLGAQAQFFGGLGASGDADGPVVEAAATATLNTASGKGTLRITATIKSGWHIYSITQPKGGPVKTVLKIDPKADVEATGEPTAITKPDSHPEPAFDNLMVETHEGEAVWEIPVRVKQGIRPQDAKITGAVFAQACAEACLAPTNYSYTTKISLEKGEAATADATAEAEPAPQEQAIPAPAPAPVTDFHPERLHVTLRGWIEPAVVTPGSVANLVIEAIPDDQWYVYGLEERPQSAVGPRPTLIVLTDTAQLTAQPATPDVAPEVKPGAGNEPPQATHFTPVKWTVPLEVPADAQPGPQVIAGIIGMQSCKPMVSCDLPTSVRFEGTLTIAAQPATGPTGLQFVQGKSYQEAEMLVTPGSSGGTHEAAQAPTGEQSAEVASYKLIELNASQAGTLPMMILFGLVGGLILNLMPCVLPVIGLKILGFAQQAGHDRKKILALNLWYSAGMILVFVVLATLAAGAKLGIANQDLAWGQQFSSTAFNVVMAGLVFVMALSFLGVWEIPIPGFIGSGKAQKVASHEGASGAFAKGVLTTVLATPCSGPFLGPVFGFTLTQSPSIIYVLFIAIGLGMALPYLVIGIFPSLIAWLPKPGAWMETFKQFMGFIMLGTVAFIFSFMQKDWLVPMFVLLIALWAACWWIGRTPTYEPVGKQLLAWLQGGAVAAVLGWFAFTQLGPVASQDLKWQPFSRAELARLNSEGKTVLVDFSAEWCATCKLNLKMAIDIPAVAEAVDRNGVVPMLADWTDGSEEVTEMLASLNSKSIPVLAIFPADRPGEVLVLRDLVSRRQVLAAIQKAGPSRTTTQLVQAATTTR